LRVDDLNRRRIIGCKQHLAGLAVHATDARCPF
jgi:hypothetical protein